VVHRQCDDPKQPWFSELGAGVCLLHTVYGDEFQGDEYKGGINQAPIWWHIYSAGHQVRATKWPCGAHGPTIVTRWPAMRSVARAASVHARAAVLPHTRVSGALELLSRCMGVHV
jgi:hypothetical protein